MWELVIIYGISTMGTGDVLVSKVPSKEMCISVMNEVFISGSPLDSPSKDGAVIVFCRPKGK